MTTLITGGNIIEATIAGGEGFLTGGLGGNAGKLLCAGFAAFHKWTSGGTILECAESAGLAYIASYVSGEDVMGSSAGKGATILFDCTYGFGANAMTTVADTYFINASAEDSESQPMNFSGYAATSGNGGGKFTYAAIC